MRIQLAKETIQLPVGKKVQWPGVLVFANFPESCSARLSCLFSRVVRYSRLGKRLFCPNPWGISWY